jgi:tryptophan synthase beta chain
MKLAATMRPDQHLLINLSGRGDKDIGTVADLSGADFYCRPSCRGQGVKGGAPQAATLSLDAHSITLTRGAAAPRSEVKEEAVAESGRRGT